jgi:imidazolonepropionase-like amidohydrolase
MSKMAPEESRAMFTTLRQQLVYELWKAGVPLMAGSDSPEYFIVQGFALHDELRTMVEAGLTPFAALQTATVNPARYMAILDRTATVEEGKEADMILLNSNPLEDINNTRSIYHIFNGETWYDEAGVKDLLDDAKALGR